MGELHRSLGQSSADVLEVAAPTHHVYADNLKVALVSGVIVAHVTMAWADLHGAWVLSEPAVRDPLLSLLELATIVGASFGMPLFFLIAGMFTPASLERKGLRRFAIDRTVRLLIPSLVFVLLLTPPIEYADSDTAGWTKGYWAFVPHVWSSWPPPPGPTWFLGVLLAFSLLYGAARTVWPRRTARNQPLRREHLVIAVATIAVTSYVLRIWVPMGREIWHLALGQAPAWIVGFTLGVLGGERGWFQPLDPELARTARRVAWPAMALCAAGVAVVASAAGLDVLLGGGTWQSLGLATLEGTIMVMLWLVDLFQRRLDHHGRLGSEMSRAAYAAFLVHQIVLVGPVLATRHVAWPPELEYLEVATLGVAISFALGALLVRMPGLSRIV